MDSSSSLLSPSHTPTSSEKLADIASRVVRELHLDRDPDPDPGHDGYPFEELDDFYSSLRTNDDVTNNDGDDVANNDGGDVTDDDEFEFCDLSGDHNYTSPISADDIFSNGQIKPLYYPLFDTSLLNQYDAVSGNKQPQPTPLRLPLRKLMTEEAGASCSSSEADDLDGVPHETYCVWVPHDSKNNKDVNTDDVATMKKKSKSTGSSNNSKRWRIRDYLIHYNRSNSDGKDKFVFLTQPRRGGGVHQITSGGGGGGDMSNKKQPIPADKKKKTYLPYRQDLVGFFSTPTGLNRTGRHF